MAKDKKVSAATPEGEQDQAHAHAEIKVTHLQVRALKAGFRRAGRSWPAEEVTVAAEEFTAEQIEQLLGEPNLVVVPVGAE